MSSETYHRPTENQKDGKRRGLRTVIPSNTVTDNQKGKDGYLLTESFWRVAEFVVHSFLKCQLFPGNLFISSIIY